MDRSGYAAFSLTVAPYAWMSVINLFGHLVTLDYSAEYLAESEVLRGLWENLEEGFVCIGNVETLTPGADKAVQRYAQDPSRQAELPPS